MEALADLLADDPPADGAQVAYHDPFVPTAREDGHCWESVELTAERIGAADAVVILTDHSSFDYQWIFEHSRVLIDTRNATANVPDARAAARPERWIVKGGCPDEG